MTGLLDLEAIASTPMRDDPYRWGMISNAFRSNEAALALSGSFPVEDYTHYTRHSTAKEYDTYGRFLVKMGHASIHEPDTQPDPWRHFANELLSVDYIRSVEAASGVELGSAHIEVVLWRLTEGCKIGPHTDNPLKRVSHLFYFNTAWTGSQGGNLRILRSWKLDDVAAEVPPLLGTSLVLVRGRDSWHGYAPVHGPIPRLAVQVSFCECAAV